MIRLIGGLGVALRISLISVLVSIPLGILLGALMNWKNPITKAILRVYLEFIRIMPQRCCCFWFILEVPEHLDGNCPVKQHPLSCLFYGEQRK